jgi:alpha-glucosidase (family GH31 glycosyl hydrolase)
MVLEFPEDPAGYAFDLQYCLGRELLVSPVVNADGWVTTYLPQGHWLDWWSGATVEGPTTLRRKVPLREMPLYLRENSLLPLGPERSHVGERPADPLTVDAFVTSQAEFSLRSDAGKIVLCCRRQDRRIAFEASDATCTYILRVYQRETPTSVRADGTGLARVELRGLAEIDAGWTLDRTVVVVKARARRIEIE